MIKENKSVGRSFMPIQIHGHRDVNYSKDGEITSDDIIAVIAHIKHVESTATYKWPMTELDYTSQPEFQPRHIQ